jgi:hypothetical protein
MEKDSSSSKTFVFLLGGLLGLGGGVFLGKVSAERENILIPFNGSAKFAVDNNYVKKESLANIGSESIRNESVKSITMNLR